MCAIHHFNFCFCLIRDDPKSGNVTFVAPIKKNLTPSDFTRAFFKSSPRKVPTEDRKLKTSGKDVLVKEKDILVFPFSAPTPRNLVIEAAAKRARDQSERSLKRQYYWTHEK